MIVTVKNYLKPQLEQDVLNFLDKSFSGKTGKDRSILRFGETLSYSSNKVSDTIPEMLMKLTQKIEDDGFVSDIRHVTVNRYDVGQSIAFHVDSKEAGDVITVLSLASDAVMLFKDNKGKVSRQPVPANSLLQMTDEHRYKMKHSIEPVQAVRYSIVFRKH